MATLAPLALRMPLMVVAAHLTLHGLRIAGPGHGRPESQRTPLGVVVPGAARGSVALRELGPPGRQGRSALVGPGRSRFAPSLRKPETHVRDETGKQRERPSWKL